MVKRTKKSDERQPPTEVRLNVTLSTSEADRGKWPFQNVFAVVWNKNEDETYAKSRKYSIELASKDSVRKLQTIFYRHYCCGWRKGDYIYNKFCNTALFRFRWMSLCRTLCLEFVLAEEEENSVQFSVTRADRVKPDKQELTWNFYSIHVCPSTFVYFSSQCMKFALYCINFIHPS